jgi:LPXTG-motif cell wall-anchored protein
MSRFKLISITLLACAVAAFAVAQNATLNTSGPTKNDYRLKIVQPLEGARITGSTFQVIVDTEIPAERDVRHDSKSMPHPDVDVFVDGTRQGTMRDEKNVVDVENVTPGPHTVLLVAMNKTGEIIDRKEVHIFAVAPAPVAARPVVAPPPAPAPAPPPPAYVPPPAPAPVAEPLPKTGTSNPVLALAGLGLLLGGLALRRFA